MLGNKTYKPSSSRNYFKMTLKIIIKFAIIRFLSKVTKHERNKINESLADNYTVSEFTCACYVWLIPRNCSAFYPSYTYENNCCILVVIFPHIFNINLTNFQVCGGSGSTEIDIVSHFMNH